MTASKELLGCILGSGRCLLGPHLKDVDNLSNIVTRRLDKILTCVIVEFDVLSLGNLLDELSDLVILRSLKLNVIAVVS